MVGGLLDAVVKAGACGPHTTTRWHGADRDPLVSSTPVFLDHATGDAFRYDRGRDVWAPFANMGLVKRDAAVTRGQYRPKEAHKLVEQVFTAKRHDETCRVGPACLHHWSVQGLGREFVVPVWGRWRLGVQSIRVRVPSFAVLGEAPWGALVGCGSVCYPRFPGTTLDIVGLRCRCSKSATCLVCCSM